LEIVIDENKDYIQIERVHMEEDTGKSSHSGSGRIESATSTALDFNRSGVPLVEIVTKPVISSSKQAVAYIEELRQLSIDLNISEGRLEKGNLRFDANISVASEDSTELGTKVEIKNMNSLRSLERAIDYEIERQTKALEEGIEIVQETRHWDENKEITSTMRSKEGSADYRYFSDPDLPNMFLSEEFIKEVETLMPLLPKAQREELMTTGLSLSQSNILSKSDEWIKKLYVKVFDQTKDSVASYNWITGELQGQMRKANIEVLPEWFNDDYLPEIIELIKSDKISFTSAKIILTEILTTNTTPSKVAEQKNLFQENDSEKISEMINQIIQENQDIVDRIKSGEDKLVGFLVGQLMKQSNGSVNPGMAKELLLKELED